MKIHRAKCFSKNIREGQWQGSGGPQLNSGTHFQPWCVREGFSWEEGRDGGRRTGTWLWLGQRQMVPPNILGAPGGKGLQTQQLGCSPDLCRDLLGGLIQKIPFFLFLLIFFPPLPKFLIMCCFCTCQLRKF